MCSLIPYLYIYTTTRFTLSAKVKVIVKAEEVVSSVSHFLAFCAAKLGIFFHPAKRIPNYFTNFLIKGTKKEEDISLCDVFFLTL